MSRHETTAHLGHNGTKLRIAPNPECDSTNYGCAVLTANDGDDFHVSGMYAPKIAERICQAAGTGAVLIEAADQPAYDELPETLEEREQLPARFHVPHWLDTCEPKAWVCAVCWDEGT